MLTFSPKTQTGRRSNNDYQRTEIFTGISFFGGSGTLAILSTSRISGSGLFSWLNGTRNVTPDHNVSDRRHFVFSHHNIEVLRPLNGVTGGVQPPKECTQADHVHAKKDTDTSGSMARANDFAVFNDCSMVQCEWGVGFSQTAGPVWLWT